MCTCRKAYQSIIKKMVFQFMQFCMIRFQKCMFVCVFGRKWDERGKRVVMKSHKQTNIQKKLDIILR